MGDSEKEDARQLFGELVQITDAIDEQLAGAKTLAQLLGVTKSDLDQIQRLAKKVFAERRYKDSADLYLLLLTLDPEREQDWLNLGTAEYLAKELKKALDAYSMASWACPNDPAPNLHLADVFIAIGDLDAAVKALTLGIDCVEQNPDHQKLLKQAKKLRSSLLRRQGRLEEE